MEIYQTPEGTRNPDPVDPLAQEAGRLEYFLRCASAACTACVELAEDPKVEDAFRLIWTEIRVARRRAENVGKFLGHPARRQGR